ncbi:hypothetical protein J4731_12780 [Providencia rettgeri]|nr:hypothetical protein [Providencia rettgeri]
MHKLAKVNSKMHKVLDMGRTTLWRKLKQYEINIKDYK